ncbi:coiled-coil-helix-coiled-coil-helix domain-containing protein 5 isoform X2 [Lagenorhynchus albirostris]|uniref:coiled-coil-helix-coiled-coil-helix domain-containing protein 5 isoform X2 n=1 Tax=Lagenorhynchus albirostris TaxID=27610 RepID=UPI0028EF65E2|nr:coiled-coil-helix-coiled-coil-helix domain-containing protein 5 isoform X2 [Lagenorhynchus albirostris]
MQAALEITARYCGRELEQYGQCVAAKPESWQRDCHHLKMSIAQCTSAQHSHFLPPEDPSDRSRTGRERLRLMPPPLKHGQVEPEGCGHGPGFPGHQGSQ